MRELKKERERHREKKRQREMQIFNELNQGSARPSQHFF